MSWINSLLTISFFSLIGSGIAQATHVLSGKVELNGAAVSDELIYVFGADTNLVMTELTDKKGAFSLNLKEGTYLLAIRNPFYEPYLSAPISLRESLTLEPIVLKSSTKELNQVEVRAAKQVIEREPGKMIFNVEQSLQATGSSAWEVISKAPGVVANSNDQLLVNGKSGVMVQINGKQLRMSGSDLADYLRAIGSSSIEKIEFLTNPGAAQDAEGVVIINIIMKKDARFGTNGSITVNAGHGFYPKYGASLQLNHRSKSWSTFFTYGYSYRKGFNDLRLNRKFYEQDSLYLVYDQENYMTFPFQSHMARFGTEYQIKDNQTIALTLSGNQNGFTRSGQNFSDVLDGNQNKTSMFITDIGGFNNWSNMGANLTYSLQTDTLRSSLNLDADYAQFLNVSNQDIATSFYNNQQEPIAAPYVLFGDLSGQLDIFAFKIDRERNFAKSQLAYGGKVSYVEADNDVKFYDRSNNSSVLDSTKSNHFLYTEQISAAYISFMKKLDKWSYNLGLRGENTQIEGIQLTNNQSFDTSYFQLFPSASVGYSPWKEHHFDLNLNRRIERPGYGQLNPFKFYLDPTTYREGNPYLRPQTTYTAELAYTFKSKFFFQGGYARTSNNIIEIIAPSFVNPNVTVQTNVNLFATELIYLNASLPFDLSKWYNLRLDLGGYQALYSGNAASTQLQNAGTWNGNAQMVNQIRVGKAHSFEVTGMIQSREVYAFDRIRPRGGVGLGYQWRCLDGNGTLRLNVTDLFYTQPIFADVAFTGYDEYFEVRRETRVATVAFSYRFGNMKGGNGHRRNGGAEELKQRAGGGLG